MHAYIHSILITCNEEQMIIGYPIDGAMVSLGGGRVRKLSVVCLHNNAIVARGILVTLLHCGIPEPCLIYTVSSVGIPLVGWLYCVDRLVSEAIHNQAAIKLLVSGLVT